MQNKSKILETGWGKEFHWGEYQQDLILPNLLRLINIAKDEIILDLGCGPGLFAKEFIVRGASVVGVDVSSDLIKLAKNNVPAGRFIVGSAENMDFLKNEGVDKATMILTAQNIENIAAAFRECYRILKSNGRLFLVINHPAFRIPKQSSWEWDENNKVQYRRIDKYLSEFNTEIQMHPGDKPDDYTLSFHRPLQTYFKNLTNGGFYISRLEEWVSDKKSEPGPRADAENNARKEIPLLLFIEAYKL